MADLLGDWGGGAVWRVTSGAFPSNAYFCQDGADGGGILIDAGLDGASIDAELSEHGLRPRQVFCTHGHFDHAGSASHFQQKYGCAVFLHRADGRTLKASNFMLMALKLELRVKLPEISYVDDQFSVPVGAGTLRYLSTPGHTPGSCVLELGNAWFTGDTLYSRGVGLSRLPGEDPTLLKASLLRLWPGLSRERIIYPGHGNPADGASVRAENRALQTFLGLAENDGHA